MANPQPNAMQRMIGSTNPKQDGAEQKNASGKKNSGATDSTIQRILSDLNNLTRRLRLVEERLLDLRKKVDMVEENSTSEDKELHIQNKATNAEVSETKKNVSEMKDKMNIMIKELQNSAKLTDVQVLEKYISMWEPIDYVTYESVEKTVEHMIDLKMNELNLKIQQEKFIKKEIERQLSKTDVKENLEQEKNVVNNDKKTTYAKMTDEDGREVYEQDTKQTSVKKNSKEDSRNVLKEMQNENSDSEKKEDSDSELESITNEINDILAKKNQTHENLNLDISENSNKEK